MTTEAHAARQQWLDALQPGDPVLIEDGGYGLASWRKATLQHRTPSGLLVVQHDVRGGTTEQYRQDGSARSSGRRSWLGSQRLVEPTQERLDAMRGDLLWAKVTREVERLCRERGHRTIPPAQLEQALQLLQGQQPLAAMAQLREERDEALATLAAERMDPAGAVGEWQVGGSFQWISPWDYPYSGDVVRDGDPAHPWTWHVAERARDGYLRVIKRGQVHTAREAMRVADAVQREVAEGRRQQGGLP